MKTKRLVRAASEAISLTRILASCLPAECQVPAEDVFAAVWPLACELARLKRRARRDKKAAKTYRRLRAEVAEVMRTQPEAVVPMDALLRTVPLDPGRWQAVLAPGVSATALGAAAA